MDKAGVINKDVVLGKLGNDLSGKKNEKLEALVSKCIEEKGADNCESAYKMYKCYWTNKVKAA